MQITIIQIGKTAKKYFIDAENEYLKRLRPYTEIKINNLKEANHGSNPTPSEVEQIKKKEADRILTKIPKDDFVIALDEHGTELTSQKFAEVIRQKRDQSTNITIIIGGAFGLHPSILNQANLTLSFSRLTFTHQMIRPLLLEQLYRAFTIISGKKYHY